MKPRIALRIDVPGYSARSALPVLVDLLRKQHAGASFVFALGPDWLGRSLARHCAGTLKQVRDACFDLGTYGWQPGQWLKLAERMDIKRTTAQLEMMTQAFTRVFEMPPTLHAAPGWRSNPHALRLTQRLGFQYASDTRGRHPFIPVWNGEIVRCPQIPVTLPTLDELLTLPRQDPAELIASVLALTANPSLHDHVFSLQATRALGNAPQAFERLLAGWCEQGYEVTSIQSLASHLVMDKLPRHEIVVGKVPGRNGTVLLQGDEFLSAWRNPT
ncbi:MAG: 4-deoxy-4-formamido-L-arabinose-phosphoundecaprenol deformylase [Pseudomonadota bacterium]